MFRTRSDQTRPDSRFDQTRSSYLSVARKLSNRMNYHMVAFHSSLSSQLTECCFRSRTHKSEWQEVPGAAMFLISYSSIVLTIYCPSAFLIVELRYLASSHSLSPAAFSLSAQLAAQILLQSISSFAINSLFIPSHLHLKSSNLTGEDHHITRHRGDFSLRRPQAARGASRRFPKPNP